MALVAGTQTKYEQVGVREDLNDIISDISPNETPFLTLVGTGPAPKNTFVEWQIDTTPQGGTNEVLEGDDVTYKTASATVRVGSYTQIMDKAIVITDTADAITTAGRKKETAYQMAKRARELKMDQEHTMVMINQGSRAGSRATTRRLASVNAWIKTNANRGTGGSGATPGASGGWTTSTKIVAAATDGSSTRRRTFTETLLKSSILTVWTNGGEVSTVLVSGKNKQIASAFGGIATKFQDFNGRSGKENAIIAAADIYVSDFGRHRIVPSRKVRDRDVFLLDPEYWDVSYLIPYTVENLAKTGHANKKMMKVEFTLRCRNEASSGGIFDLNT
jgi:hypothetical protein